MLLKVWDKISYIGTSQIKDKRERRNVVISNRLVTGIFLSNIVLFFAMVAYSGLGPLAKIMIIGNFSSWILILGLTHFGYHVVARVFLGLMISLFTFASTIISKIDTTQIWDDQFYAPRFYITMTAIIPILIFSSRQIIPLGISLAVSFLTLLLYDPIHNYFGVGYYQSGHNSESYPFFTVITMVGYLLVVISLLVYKRIIEKYEREQAEFTSALAEKNAIIQEQKSRLELSNDELNLELRDKNKELIKSLSELRQFSYTLSHNLRSPVASLLGLTNLLKSEKKEFDEGTEEVLDHIKSSASDLEETMTDLGKLLEIRDEIGVIKEDVDVGDEIRKVLNVLDGEIVKNQVEIAITTNHQSTIHSVRAYIHSILYNLISNAVKFRVPEGNHRIDIYTKQEEGQMIISIKDNGIGMDLEKYGDQLFKMYKRLNLHTKGKGLGLYIANYQIEALGGSIEVSSAPGKGTTFVVKLPE